MKEGKGEKKRRMRDDCRMMMEREGRSGWESEREKEDEKKEKKIEGKAKRQSDRQTD